MPNETVAVHNQAKRKHCKEKMWNSTKWAILAIMISQLWLTTPALNKMMENLNAKHSETNINIFSQIYQWWQLLYCNGFVYGLRVLQYFGQYSKKRKEIMRKQAASSKQKPTVVHGVARRGQKTLGRIIMKDQIRETVHRSIPHH